MNEKEWRLFFTDLYADHHRAVFAYILTRVNEREVAKDLLQETFLRVWNQIHVGFEIGRHQSRYWLYKITKNMIIDYYRRKASRHYAEVKVKTEAASMIRYERSAEEVYETKYDLQSMEASIQRLPEELRSVLLLNVVGNMNSTEIGEWLDIPAGTVRYRLSLARKRLSDDMAANLELERGTGYER